MKNPAVYDISSNVKLGIFRTDCGGVSEIAVYAPSGFIEEDVTVYSPEPILRTIGAKYPELPTADITNEQIRDLIVSIGADKLYRYATMSVNALRLRMIKNIILTPKS